MNESAVDNQLHEARQELHHQLAETEDGVLSQDQAMAFFRLAYGKGYLDALKAEDPESCRRTAILLGLLNPETGEIC